MSQNIFADTAVDQMSARVIQMKPLAERHPNTLSHFHKASPSVADSGAALVPGFIICSPSEQEKVERIVMPFNQALQHHAEVIYNGSDEQIPVPCIERLSKILGLGEDQCVCNWPNAARIISVDLRKMSTQMQGKVIGQYFSASTYAAFKSFANGLKHDFSSDSAAIRVELVDGQWFEFVYNRITKYA